MRMSTPATRLPRQLGHITVGHQARPGIRPLRCFCGGLLNFAVHAELLPRRCKTCRRNNKGILPARHPLTKCKMTLQIALLSPPSQLVDAAAIQDSRADQTSCCPETRGL